MTRRLRPFVLAMAAAVVSGLPATAAPLGTAKATVVLRGKTYTFSGATCKPAVLGLSVVSGSQGAALTSPKARYFSLLYTQSSKTGTYKVKGTGTVQLIVNRKLTGMSTFTLKLEQNGKRGTFAGKVEPSYGGGTFSGSFAC